MPAGLPARWPVRGSPWYSVRPSAAVRSCAGPADGGLRRLSWRACRYGGLESLQQTRRCGKAKPALRRLHPVRGSERHAHHQLVAGPGFLGLELVLVVVAVELVLEGVELVEELVLARVEQVVGRQPHREVPAEALLDEGVQFPAVPDDGFLAEEPGVGVALLAVGQAEAGGQGRQVLDEADVEGALGLVVEAPPAHEVIDP